MPIGLQIGEEDVLGFGIHHRPNQATRDTIKLIVVVVQLPGFRPIEVHKRIGSLAVPLALKPVIQPAARIGVSGEESILFRFTHLKNAQRRVVLLQVNDRLHTSFGPKVLHRIFDLRLVRNPSQLIHDTVIIESPNALQLLPLDRTLGDTC